MKQRIFPGPVSYTHLKKLIDEAISAGLKIYGMTVTVASDCLLKAARAFLVFKAVEELGQILVYRPSSQDIEDEKFDLSFSFYVASGEGFDKLEHAASNVSEIDKVEGKEITEFHLEGEAEQTAQAPEETKKADKEEMCIRDSCHCGRTHTKADWSC